MEIPLQALSDTRPHPSAHCAYTQLTPCSRCVCGINSSSPTPDPKHHTPAAQLFTPHTLPALTALRYTQPSQPLSCTVLHTSTPQGSLPLAFAALLVRPAPAVLYLFLAARLGENAVNHSGLDSQLLDVLTLKVIRLTARAVP